MTRRLMGTALVTIALAAMVSAQVRPDRSKPPALGAAPRLTLPAIQKRALTNGLPVWIVEQHEVPLVQVNLVVMAGANDDPAGKFGVSSLTSAMLDEGAGKRNALDIADAVDVLGADLSTTSSFDASAVRLNVPVAHVRLPLVSFSVPRQTMLLAQCSASRTDFPRSLSVLPNRRSVPVGLAWTGGAATVTWRVVVAVGVPVQEVLQPV